MESIRGDVNNPHAVGRIPDTMEGKEIVVFVDDMDGGLSKCYVVTVVTELSEG